MTGVLKMEADGALERKILVALTEHFASATADDLRKIEPARSVAALLTVAAALCADAEGVATDAGRRQFAAVLADGLARRIAHLVHPGAEIIPIRKEPSLC